MDTLIEQILKDVNLLVAQKRFEDKERFLRGERFNIFKVCGIDHYELQHSSIIAALLDPHGDHGQGELYLKLFMKEYGSKLPIDKIEYDKVCVRKEEWTEAYDGRMDIYVEYDGLPLLIIENKLYAKDQSIQLKKYKEDADLKIMTSRNKSHQYEILYLTLDGKDATDDSGEGVDYVRISYASHIIKWLDACMENSNSIPIIKETLLQYQNHLKQLTNQDFNMSYKNELFEIMEKYPSEVDEIVKMANSGAYFDHLFKTYLQPKLEKYASSKKLEYIEPLWFSNKAWHGAKIGIETRYVGCYAGILYETEKEIQPTIWNLGSQTWWPYGWTRKDIFYQWGETSLFSKILDGTLYKEIVKAIDELLEDMTQAGVDLSKPIKDHT